MRGKGLSGAESAALGWVESHPGYNASVLAYISGIDNIHARLKRLQVRGLVERSGGGWCSTRQSPRRVLCSGRALAQSFRDLSEAAMVAKESVDHLAIATKWLEAQPVTLQGGS